MKPSSSRAVLYTLSCEHCGDGCVADFTRYEVLEQGQLLQETSPHREISLRTRAIRSTTAGSVVSQLASAGSQSILYAFDSCSLQVTHVCSFNVTAQAQLLYYSTYLPRGPDLLWDMLGRESNRHWGARRKHGVRLSAHLGLVGFRKRLYMYKTSHSHVLGGPTAKTRACH